MRAWMVVVLAGCSSHAEPPPPDAACALAQTPLVVDATAGVSDRVTCRCNIRPRPRC
jgi:hypothetical protein